MYAKIVRINKYDNEVTYTLDSGKELPEDVVISLVENGQIYNATVEINDGEKSVRGNERIPVKTISTDLNSTIRIRPIVSEVKDKETEDFDFERNLYGELVNWKNKQRDALLLKGPRQVGKTYLLKKFGKTEFKQMIYVDLRDFKNSSKFLKIYDGLKEEMIYDSTDEDKRLFWTNVFLLYTDEKFEDTSETLIIIDEIQENSEIYSNIRDINRSLNARLVATGSYLGIVEYSNDYWISAGDYAELELNSLSYVEFLKALGLYDNYNEIKSYDKNKLNDKELNIYNKVEEAYEAYSKIGGYPAVVQEYLRSKGDISSCMDYVGRLLNSFYSESGRYFKDIIEENLWEKAMILVVQDLLNRSNSLKGGDLLEGLTFRDSRKNKGLDTNRREVNNVVSWLLSCNILGEVYSYSNFKDLNRIGTSRYYFKDMGFLNYLSSFLPSINESTKVGIRAENFVYLYLTTQVSKSWGKGLFIEDKPCYAVQYTFEIDFLMHSQEDKRIALEVKNSKGATKSSDYALDKGYVDKVIKIQNTYGDSNINESDSYVIPIFAVDKLDLIV